MILERNKRFFKRYVMRFKPRTKNAPTLPLIASQNKHSVLRALQRSLGKPAAILPQTNGDSIELIKAVESSNGQFVYLLFHRSSPNAADPSYRRRKGEKLTLRHSEKEDDEEQTFSSHLIISTREIAPGAGYSAVLEEVPGLSFSAVGEIIARVLADYKYSYSHKKKEFETYTVLKTEGIKSESLTNSLKNKGSLNYLTLRKNAPVDVPDAEGIIEPQSEIVKYRIVGDPTNATWQQKLKSFAAKSVENWDLVTVDITLDDGRSKTVRLDIEDEASEILFVRSELAYLDSDVAACSLEIVSEITKAAKKIIGQKP